MVTSFPSPPLARELKQGLVVGRIVPRQYERQESKLFLSLQRTAAIQRTVLRRFCHGDLSIIAIIARIVVMIKIAAMG